MAADWKRISDGCGAVKMRPWGFIVVHDLKENLGERELRATLQEGSVTNL
jgi:hypothetical protein